MRDPIPAVITGHVQQFACSPTGERRLACEHRNLFVTSGYEVILLALMGEDSIAEVQFGLANGVRPTPGQRSIRSPLARAPIVTTDGLAPYLSRDAAGQRTVGTWTAVYEAVSGLTYDTLGLVSSGSLLVAATTFPSVTLAPGESRAIQWTLYLRGN